MQFDDDAQLDSDQVRDERGSGPSHGGFSGGFGLPGGRGGLVGLILALVAAVVGVPLALTDGSGSSSHSVSSPGGRNSTGAVSSGSLAAKCRTGADANTTDATGDTLLMAAVRTGDIDAVRVVIERGARVNTAEPELGHTALMWAARTDNAALVRLLLELGAPLDTATRVGPKPEPRPPGTGGGSHGVGIVRSGVPPQGEQLPAPGGMTALMFAARDGCLHAADALIAAHASVNAPDPNGMTPLLLAITNNQIAVAQLLTLCAPESSFTA